MNNIDLAAHILAMWRGRTAHGIDPQRTALIVVDRQVGFISNGYPACCHHAIDVIPNVNRLIAAFRRSGAHIVFTRHTVVDEPPRAPAQWQLDDSFFSTAFETLKRGAPGHSLHPDLDVVESDHIVDKYRYSAFLPFSSPLDAELSDKNIDTVVITGTITNICCESSARDAYMLN